MTKDTLYKVGDKIWVHDSHRCWRNFNGESGVVQSIAWSHGETHLYEVMVENGDVEYFTDYHLRLNKEDYMKENNCSVCKEIITHEHGGIHCSCGRIFCCEPECIPEHYCSKGISQRQDIDICPSCEDELLAEFEKEKEDAELDALYGPWY